MDESCVYQTVFYQFSCEHPTFHKVWRRPTERGDSRKWQAVEDWGSQRCALSHAACCLSNGCVWAAGGGGVIYYFGCCLCFCGLGVNCTYISWPASLVFDDRACLTVITNWAGRSLRVLAFIPLLVVEATLRYSLCWLRSHCWLPLPLPLFLFELRK